MGAKERNEKIVSEDEISPPKERGKNENKS